MVNSRRTAREIALKVLYQIDVGKQDATEAIEGALEQIRATVDHPVQQVTREASQQLRAMAVQAAADLTSIAARQIRQAATSASKALAQLAESASAETRILVAERAPTADREVEARLRAALEAARIALHRISERDSPYAEQRNEIVQTALQRLAQMEQAYRRHLPSAMQTGDFMIALVRGVVGAHQEIDLRLSALATSWSLERQAAVDRNIMRLAAYEIVYLSDIPTGASINEAVELAKKFSTAESGRFVNGVLGALAGSPAVRPH